MRNRDVTETKVMLLYPPGKPYQRGEDRCQGNIEDSTATNIRACNDLGYVASGLRGLPYRIMLKDYPAEKGTLADLLFDFKRFFPDVIFMSITHATIFYDLGIVSRLKEMHPKLVVILKGALFFDPSLDRLARLDIQAADYLIGGESDFVAARLIHRHFRGKPVDDLSGVIYRKEGRWVKTRFDDFETDLDSLRFPDRSLMDIRLYTRPDRGEPQATISVARGCPSSCIYCLTPIISGRKLRQRSPENVMQELRECFHTHRIRHFFLKSDTFTMDARWVKALCHRIIGSELHGKITWVANSRTRPLSQETLVLMKRAGCWLVAFGFESGHEDSLVRMKKTATISDSFRAVAMSRQAGLKVFGFFMAGFPWESMAHLKATKELVFALNPDFIELHIPIPYDGTELKHQCRLEGLTHVDELGKDYFGTPVTGTRYVSREEIQRFRKRVIIRFYFRFTYLVQRLKDTLSNPRAFYYYGKYGLRLIRNLVF